MADATPPKAPSPWTPELIRYLGTLTVLTVLSIVLASTGQRDALNMVLGGLVGYATSGHPSGSQSGSTVAVVTMGAAFGANLLGHVAGV